MAFWPKAAHYPAVTESQPWSGRVLKEEVGGRRPPRPPEATERFAVAVEIASGGSTALRRYARRFSLCSDDAEDACQRGLEILLTKAPTASRAELRSWLFTVVKHEALAVRHQRERAAAAGSAEDIEAFTAERAPEPTEQASGTERTRRAAEALGHLKPAELRCMLLKAMGFSYEEIAQRTGFSFTKVNRCLTEGRRSFLDRFDRISAGAGCAELRPLLSAASDGECPPRGPFAPPGPPERVRSLSSDPADLSRRHRHGWPSCCPRRRCCPCSSARDGGRASPGGSTPGRRSGRRASPRSCMGTPSSCRPRRPPR